jgi:hypothetical protein
MTKFNKKFNISRKTCALLGVFLLSINLFFIQNVLLGILGAFLYSLPLAKHIGSFFYRDKDFFWGFSALLCSIILLNTGIYYIFGITKITSLIVLWLPLLTFVLRKSKSKNLVQTINHTSYIINHKFFFVLLFIILEFILFRTLYLGRTVELMSSPWQAVGPWFFIFYATATGLLFYIIFFSPLYNKKNTRAEQEVSWDHAWIILALTSLHLFLTFSITPILYPLGWGFDAFVHRTTEIWIQINGFILPKQPYYIGQYSFVTWLSNVLAIPIFFIDVYLLPILASLLLPATIIKTLKSTWGIANKYSLLLVWLIPFVPFLHLHLTTPHNLVLFFSIMIVFATLAFLNNKLHWSIPLLLSITAAATHPLVGGPMFVFTLFSLVIKKLRSYKQILLLILVFLSTTLLLPVLFIFNNLRAGVGWPTFVNPLTQLDHVLALFQRPYWYLDSTPLVFELLYGWQLLIVPTVIVLALLGFCSVKNKLGVRSYQFGVNWIFPISALGFVLSGFLLRSWIIFPDVVSYEQGDFPLRIIKAALIFALPFAMYGMYQLINFMERKKLLLIMFHVLWVTLLMLSFYLSYPQRNIKARFPGLNITDSDFKAVDYIHNQHKDYDYIVLSNQLVSAAALTNYSFAKYFNTPEGEIFYYSIPTGGVQYQQYGRMLYEGQKKEYMQTAMDKVDVDTGYFVVNKYWANSDKIIEGAKKSADNWHIINDGDIWIFTYSRKAQ